MQAEAALSARVDEAHNVIEIPDSDDEQLLNDVDDLLQDNGSWTLDLLPAGQPDEATATAKNALIDLDDHDANRIDGAEAAFTGGLSSGVQLERRSTRSQSPASRQIEYEALLSSPDPLELGPLTAARTAPFSRPLRTASHSEGSPTRFVIAQQKDNQRRQAAEGKRSPQSAAVNAQLASSDDELPFIGQIPRLPVPSAVHRVDIAESSDSDTVEVTTMSARVANRRSAVTNTKSGSAVAAMPPAITEDSDGDLELPPVIQPVQTVSPTTGASPNSGLVDANPKLRVPEPVVSLIQSPSPPPLARGRSLRQRTAVQKQPYTMEFARFATAAVKNQWSGIVITDGLNTKDKAQHASDRPAKPKAIDTLGGWLVPEDGQVEQVVTQGDDDSGTYELQRASSEAAADGRAEKRKRSKVTNPSSGDMRSAERPKFVWNVAAADDASTSALTYEELVAIRDANAKHAARMAAGRDSRADFAVGRSRHGEDETVTRRSRSSSEPAPSTQQSRSARSAPSRKKRRTKITSSSSRHGQPRSQEAHGGKVFDVQTSDEDRSHAAGSEAFDVDSSDSDSQGGGESPERPAAAEMPEDRFKLTGKRKRAIKGMMPNSWIKKAERDLLAMREEKKHGKRVREVVDVDSADEDDEDDMTNNAGRARVRRNADLADRPMRFAIDISSDEALSSQDEAEDDEAHQQLELQEASMTWADQNHSNRKSNTAYWDGVIDRIFVRQKHGTGAGKRRQAVKQRDPQLTLPHTTGKASYGDIASPRTPHAQDQLQRKRKPKRQQRLHFVKPAVQLDTEAAIFSELRGPKADIDNSRGVPQAADSAAPLVPNIASRADDLTTFSRFTFDYGLDRLPAGLRFAQETYIARGHLRNLLGPTVAGAAIEDRRSSCRSFGISLDHDMRIADFIDFFPLICDNIVNAVSADGYQPNLHDEVCEVMRFTSSFMMDCDAQDEVARVQTALDEIDSRLLLWKLSTNASETSVAHATLVWRWCQLEYALRMHGKCRSRRDESRPPQIAGDITDAVTALLECLLTIGLHRVTQTLRTASESADAILDDVICEVWVALLHVTSLEHRHTAFTQDYLWKGVIGQLQQHARQHGIHPVLRGEIASHAACALSALSQFTQTGLCIGQPSISPFWPIVLDIIDTIKPQELNAAYVNMDNVGKTRASRYIWCIFARCLVLSSRWNWPVLEQSKLFGRLFDIFNARELQDFSIDGEAAFPAFLAAYNGHIDDKPGHSDSVFVLFLRLIAKAGSECVADGSDRARTMLNRVLMRVTPMRERLPFLQNQPALSKRKHRSSLVNHYALLLVLMTLDSASTAKRLTRMQNLLAFEEADFAARQECLKAICYSGTVLMHTGQPFDALLAWVTTLAERLRAAYLPLAKERLSLVVPLREKSLPSHVAANNANKPAILDRTAHLARINLQMSQYAVLLAAIMSCVRGFILEQSKRSPATYPSLNLLHTGMCSLCAVAKYY